MDEPLVCCILPYHTLDYYLHAVDCFESQTYQNKQIIQVNTSEMPRIPGMVRNNLIALSPRNCLIAHWDHDDWSCPTRLAEQVAFIQSTGASIVGYRDMPFYEVGTGRVTLYRQPRQNYALGTSLMYWRSAWEQHPFIEVAGDEDSKFEQAVGFDKVATQTSVGPCPSAYWDSGLFPRMVARIHPGNTSKKGGARYEKATPELEAAVLSCIASSIVAQ